MKSNYKRLGKLIENLNERNIDLNVQTLLGVNLDKKFIPSIANIVGTDLSTYKIVRKGQFACKLMSVGRDGILPVAFLEAYDEAIVSGAYYTFRVKDESVVIPKYLMLCFSRPEFDRELSFGSGGDVRGGANWEVLCDIKVPIPSLVEQQKIVDAYNVIENRIALKRKINDNLEAQAATLYWQWIDYFSAQGLVSVIPLGNLIKLFDNQRVPLSSSQRANMEQLYPYYGAASLMDYVDNYIYDGIFLLIGEDGSVTDERGYPILQYVNGKFWVNNHAHVIQGKNGYSTEMLRLLLKRTNITEYVTGAVQAKLNQENLNAIPVVALNEEIRADFDRKIQQFFANIRHNEREKNSLELTKAQIFSGIASQT